MAKRAVETFHIALEDGTRTYEKDAVVPSAVARKCADLVYDDDAKSAKKVAAQVDG